MNIFIGLISLFVCTYIGYMLADKYVNRKKFYYDFNEFNKKIKNEINYSQNTILSVVNGFVDVDSDFYKSIKDVVVDKIPFSFSEKYIDSEEITFLKTYIENVGSGDISSQIKFTENAYEILNEKYKKACEDEKKYKKLYIKLGFLVGLIIFIVLI